MVGQKLGHYSIVERIGAGGMGEVYRAHDEQLDRDIALKVLPAQTFSDDTARARLLREARSAAALNHPHICTVHEVGEADGQAYIAMELVEGRSLVETIPKTGLLMEQVLRYGAQIADALAHAHERGIVHRDLKSGNVVITADGRAKVLDFGLAKRMSTEELVEATTESQASLTQPGAVLGTLPYMAPEQLRGQPADARSDVWALGVVLHEMASGARPFQGQTGYELSSAILSRPPGRLPAKVPVELRAVIERCLVKEPGQRYQRAGEVRSALETLATGATLPGLKWKYLAKRRWFRATAAVATVVLLLAVLLGLNVAGLRDRLFGSPTPKIESLAVLPLQNLSGDPEQEYFADGMTDALIGELSKISALRVISRTSVMQYKTKPKRVPEIAHELDVDAVIEGAVFRSGDRVRITATLIHGSTETRLWTENYERDLKDVLTLQQEIARGVTGEINVRLKAQERHALGRARRVNPDAYEAYLKGRYLWRQARADAGMAEALERFQDATVMDPQFAAPYAGRADCYIRLRSWSVCDKHLLHEARNAAQKALELDDSLAEGHASLATINHLDWDWVGAEREFKQAIELNPNYSIAHHGYANYLANMTRLDEAIAETELAIRLDPLADGIYLLAGHKYFAAGQLDRALELYRKDLDSRSARASPWIAWVYTEKGMYDEAIREYLVSLEGASPRSTRWWRAGLARAYALSGRKKEALEIVRELEDYAKQNCFDSLAIASIHAALGDKDRAFAWIEKGFQGREFGMEQVRILPSLAPLRDDPRFADLLRRMNFPEN